MVWIISSLWKWMLTIWPDDHGQEASFKKQKTLSTFKSYLRFWKQTRPKVPQWSVFLDSSGEATTPNCTSSTVTSTTTRARRSACTRGKAGIAQKMQRVRIIPGKDFMERYATAQQGSTLAKELRKWRYVIFGGTTWRNATSFGVRTSLFSRLTHVWHGLFG